MYIYSTVWETYTSKMEHVHYLFGGGEIPVSNSNPSAPMVYHGIWFYSASSVQSYEKQAND